MPIVSKRPTISDVARRAGTSKQTVSRVINDSPLVAKETRELVLQIIEELGYRRSELARTLTSGRSHTIAVVGDNVTFFGSESYAGFAREVENYGFSLLLKELPLNPDADAVLRTLHALLDRQVDGILWAIPDPGGDCPWLADDFLRQIPVPVVFLNTREQPGVTVVGYDNAEGARLAVRHLIAGGRRHIAHIAGPLITLLSHERVRGWREALQEAGLPHAEHQCVAGDWYAESGRTALAQLLEQFPEMDAVFVAGDYMCLGVFLEAHRRGIRIPQDLAVVGFGNRMGSECFYPPLTTIEQNKRRQGEEAFYLLIQKIERHFDGRSSQTRPRPSVLTHQLLIRESAP